MKIQAKVPVDELEFGRTFSDHMLVIDWDAETGTYCTYVLYVSYLQSFFISIFLSLYLFFIYSYFSFYMIFPIFILHLISLRPNHLFWFFHLYFDIFSLFSGWNNPQILPYGDFTVSPACSALHYGVQVS